MHKIDEFLAVCWLANLRNLGYNGRTIQRDFARIFFVVSLRKAAEQASLLLQRQPDAGIADSKAQHGALCSQWIAFLLQAHPHHYLALRGELDGIAA
jgi:hypothetical protein